VRIVYIADTREIGGAERYLVTLAEQVARSGHEVLILAPQEELVAWLARETSSVCTARAFDDAYHDASTSIRRGAALLALLPNLARRLRRLEPDVVHVNNGGFPGSDLCRIALPAARLAGVRHRVMTVSATPLARDYLTDPLVQMLADRLVWSSTHVVVCPSEAIAEGLTNRRRMPPSLRRMIYYGIAPVRQEPQVAADLRKRLAPGGELLVGMVAARPEAQKGYGVFVEALAAAGERVRGVVVGRPPDGLAAHVRAAGLEGRLAIEGPRSNVGDYYAAIDLLVVPSTLVEGMGLVILEAASVGTPAFGSRLDGIPEAITDGVSGRLFEPGSAQELAALIERAELDRGRVAAMGCAARKRWLDDFQLDTMVRATLALYGEGPSARFSPDSHKVPTTARPAQSPGLLSVIGS
jgi:glycosyltransferase involved in cell wall biosynthesis